LWSIGRQNTFSPGLVGLAERRRSPQDPKQVSVGVKLVFLCRFNQAVDHRTGLSASRSVGKQPVLPAHHKRLNAALSAVVAQFQSAVFQIAYQVCPLLQQIMQSLPKSGFWCRFGNRVICPYQQCIYRRPRATCTEELSQAAGVESQL